ncbi:PepSY-associated TM helix domain-containing protein [Solemya elarraichensis gill symbiont]|uniref:Uncharacterized protein n=1 Tax=Solemya elarraichensis gill symbiont TaxID=1918949 RepID=A0A1T2KZI7_9GAMM|nr:PepSY-associated TM helix domain-containing protein [Solemya elarraichensis gill symbiont]OOZ38252.1 hypothetical protein BOW52_08965 [Solemya elarraichensis gill symbiont]
MGRSVYRINQESGETEQLDISAIDSDVLPNEIKLGRLVRDLHYGRGIVSGDLSLWINDFSSFILAFLPLSGLIMYIKIRNMKNRKGGSKRSLYLWRKAHSNKLALFTFIPILYLLITGIFLDHTDFFRDFLKSTKLDTAYLTPVYDDLSTDIWGFDYDGSNYRVGNRLGIFKSPDLKTWELESKGFVWRLKRAGDDLYIGGMGSPNRLLTDNGWQVVAESGHMPRDVFQMGNHVHFFGRHSHGFDLPIMDRVPLYHLFLALHDGEFFHELWVYVNDLASIIAILLLITGYIKWKRHYRNRAKAH